ncbi:hypothetical protein LTR36_007389 [Oleoguttula mirabilis]|uniref:Lysophospholipase n=1 Tax=Oleoguttula mirabilis TaxID=1507867 RepID=A0AAV9J9R1_9PEZI|nr:hypothetical protein LTR36_007389 [Oleoguttula mirabilis]
MNRAVRRFQLGGRQRQYALSIALGCSTAAIYGAWHNQRFVLADGGQFGEAWRTKPTIGAQKASSPDRIVGRKGGTASSSESQDSQTASPDLVAPQPPPPPQTPGQSVFNAEGDFPENPLQAWQHATDRVTAVCGSFTGFDMTSIRERVLGLLVPTWVRMLPAYLNKLQDELSMTPWSLSWEIWEEAHDPQINPEIIWDARVRVSKELCAEEQAFLRKRRPQTARALARYLGVPESEVHPEDVPIIGMCGSGGGLRALVAGASSYLSAAEDGLFDCATYSAGVSGSCWLQTLYYSSIGRQSHAHIIDHLKDRIGIHIAYPAALLSLISQAPTNKYLLSGYVEKLRGVPDADFGLVDIYGLALAARLLVPRGELGISNYDLKISNQRFYTDDGQQPLPVYTAVRHEIPGDVNGDGEQLAKDSKLTKKHHDYFQWFEWTPYEFFCEDLDAGIPTWAVGRKWEGGESVRRDNGLALPELRVPLMMGIWGSAFCATLSHYYKEVRPVLKACGMGTLDGLLAGKSDDMVKVHPIDPAVIPNFALGLKGMLPEGNESSIHEAERLQLMDAGMANNLPIYPLLRPGRDVDVIVAFDASADVRADNWIKVVDGYASQRNIKGWPMGAGWPPEENTENKTVDQLDQTQQTAAERIKDGEPPTTPSEKLQKGLSHCTIWAGSKEERHGSMAETSPPTPIDFSADSQAHQLMSPHAGIAVVYFPFLANEKVPGVDPMKAEFMSTWNFVYTPEEIDSVVKLARANFDEGREQTRRTIRAVWERKKGLRLGREQEAMDVARRRKFRTGTAAMRHGDQFGGF